MIAFLKAIPFGVFLTLLVGLFIGSAGGRGGMLNVFRFDVTIQQLSLDFDLYWSWPLFLIGLGLSWALFYMMSD